jgi:CubicO group peptidase (beta-lactamase class C family)
MHPSEVPPSPSRTSPSPGTSLSEPSSPSPSAPRQPHLPQAIHPPHRRRHGTRSLLVCLIVIPQSGRRNLLLTATQAQRVQTPASGSTAPTTSPPSPPSSHDAIAAHKLPGAVVLIGHNGTGRLRARLRQPQASRRARPRRQTLPAEPMTEDTIFDMASLTKCLATATAVMQLYEQGKLQFDDPIAKYLPEFNPDTTPANKTSPSACCSPTTPANPPTSTSKTPGASPRPTKPKASSAPSPTPLKIRARHHFEYSDINFIILGALVEKLSGQPSTSTRSSTSSSRSE